ncbi:hypothetical protein ACFOZ1_11760 [Gracilibacillus marinus]|uniref:Uncharacterized protein n=1 Tax=Gracilibacillus marinus TaxID=630535 RepID=A0ABV8VXY4_9BACI
MIKFLLNLICMLIIFSIGLFLGIDQSTVTIYPNQTQPLTGVHMDTKIDMETEAITDREAIVDEIDAPLITENTGERTFLTKVASGGEQVIQTVCDGIVTVTFTVIDEIF